VLTFQHPYEIEEGRDRRRVLASIDFGVESSLIEPVGGYKVDSNEVF
jgi:hypothetical protein